MKGRFVKLMEETGTSKAQSSRWHLVAMKNKNGSWWWHIMLVVGSGRNLSDPGDEHKSVADGRYLQHGFCKVESKVVAVYRGV